MAHTPNMQILAYLLQAPGLNTWTSWEYDEINALPPLKSFITGTPNLAFIYDEDQWVISYLKPGTPEYQEILTQEPKYRFPHIDIYEAGLATLPLD